MEDKQLTVGDLIERLRGFDPALPVYQSGECGPESIVEVRQTPIVWISEGEAGDGVVVDSQALGADHWREWVDNQREHHQEYKRRYSET